MRFKDRRDAGRRLAEKLAKRYEREDGVVYALPRGGVVLGAEIAKRLGMPLDLVLARKVGHPYSAEYAIAAVTEDGEVVTNADEVAHVPTSWFQREVDREQAEAKRRHSAYLGDRAPAPIEGRVAILVDDGIATGLTMYAAIRSVRRRRPQRIVVAVPVLPAINAARLQDEVDEVVALDAPDDYLGAVGAYYDEFDPVSDQEVIALMRAAQSLRAGAGPPS